jgi:hypothetical protein
VHLEAGASRSILNYGRGKHLAGSGRSPQACKCNCHNIIVFGYRGVLSVLFALGGRQLLGEIEPGCHELLEQRAARAARAEWARPDADAGHPEDPSTVASFGRYRPCALCRAPAVVDFPARGPQDPTAPLCDRCASCARNGAVTLGWCEAGHHYGRPLHTCPRHRIQFVALNPTIHSRRRR